MNTGDDTFEAVSVKEASRRLGLGDTALIYAAVNKRDLPARRIGRVIRIEVKDLQAWFRALPEASEESA